uniref:hypothetical protein n=1 Tax=Parasutterella excrementihominis TaxID=487175 RepID=UPI003FED5CF8
ANDPKAIGELRRFENRSTAYHSLQNLLPASLRKTMFSVFRSSSVSSSGETLESVRIAFRLSSKDYNRRRSLRTVEPTDFRRANLRRRVVLTVKPLAQDFRTNDEISPK